ncbi:hypothetical protein LTR37_012049 [Vermiconidia calcicola]|uniref:Uncharacterized protein n=1 Tax=Vermiconidia calcicola TaxID=1690605 RepID=A0ACC3N0P2_9PEZI|nr:hypothetical protein LTR37_012049 [Vermiconidia calcicola]
MPPDLGVKNIDSKRETKLRKSAKKKSAAQPKKRAAQPKKRATQPSKRGKRAAAELTNARQMRSFEGEKTFLELPKGIRI